MEIKFKKKYRSVALHVPTSFRAEITKLINATNKASFGIFIA